MRATILVSTAFYWLSTANGIHLEPKGHEYHPAGPFDSRLYVSLAASSLLLSQIEIIGRSPCPGLNALANHGWLPRSGKDISRDDIQYAISAAYNFAPDTQNFAFELVIAFQLSTTGNISTFNLEDLKAHNRIEFDGSLSRNDFYFGDNLHFDPEIWVPVARDLGLYEIGYSRGDRLVTIETAAKARAVRVKKAMQVNPQFNASAFEQAGSIGTTALYLATLWDAEVNATYKSWVKPFFGKRYHF